MERLTMASDKGGVAFTFDLDITCEKSEIEKILKLAEKLKEYEDLEEQGKMLKLPCAVGDTVYRFYTVDDETKIYEHRITTLTNIVNIMEVGEIGKTVFLTKSAAEQALKEMEDKEDE